MSSWVSKKKYRRIKFHFTIYKVVENTHEKNGIVLPNLHSKFGVINAYFGFLFIYIFLFSNK